MARAIGGYFALEVPSGPSPYPGAVAVNFGRGGLDLILRTRSFRKLWIPDYICPCVPAFLDRLGMDFGTYPIDFNLNPAPLPEPDEREGVLYVNYFGVKDATCRALEETQPRLVLDLTQAFYYQPTRADAFNSARKFFGVPDGGYAFGAGLTSEALPESHSYDACEALLRRADGDIPGGYQAFHEVEGRRVTLRATKMSRLTASLLAGCNLASARAQRRANFLQLDRALRETNALSLSELGEESAPLVYPYFVSGGASLRKKLIEHAVFCPTYWSGIDHPGAAAEAFSEHLVCLPCDQRYGADDMNRILEVIHG